MDIPRPGGDFVAPGKKLLFLGLPAKGNWLIQHQQNSAAWWQKRGKKEGTQCIAHKNKERCLPIYKEYFELFSNFVKKNVIFLFLTINPTINMKLEIVKTESQEQKLLMQPNYALHLPGPLQTTKLSCTFWTPGESYSQLHLR